MGRSSRVEDFGGDDEKYGKKRDYDPEFRGPVKSRSCTDVLCLLLLLVFVGGWAAVSVYGFRTATPSGSSTPPTRTARSAAEGTTCERARTPGHSSKHAWQRQRGLGGYLGYFNKIIPSAFKRP